MLGKIVTFLALAVFCNAQKLPVYVYYESLCPDSQAFITQQLYPTMKQMNQFVEVKFVPFGKSTYKTQGADTTFECHHGPNECYGNKVQSCAIQHIQVDSYQNDNTRETLTMEYINCLMKMGTNFPDAIYPTRKCATEVQVKNVDVIEQCANSTEGSKLLQKNGEMTMNLMNPLKEVPTITLKQLYDGNVQASALSNLRGAVCKMLVTKPKECMGADSGVASITSTILSVVAAVLVAMRAL